MQSYRELVHELIEQEITEYTSWNEGTTRADAIQHMEEEGFGDLFGNISGSRTCSTYKAKKFLSESGAVWDEEIRQLYEELGENYFSETLARGAEVFDVITCELVASRVLGEMINE